MTKKSGYNERTRLVIDVAPDLVLALDLMRKRYGVTRKAFCNEALRSLFELPNQIGDWVNQQVQKKGAA